MGKDELAADMVLKYEAKISEFENCPGPNLCVANGAAFRWVHQDCSVSSFLPVALDPENSRPPQCTSWSLSLFATDKQARARFL